MARIRVLAEDIASQIAAGEVVERPASAVKELVENALDAGGRIIRIEVTGGGLEQITVIDDGCGMDRTDAELAFQRHATSKISAVSDLDSVCTLGFRGEALPSIAAVSRFVLRTRPADSTEGTVVRVEGGRILGIGVAGGPTGTSVTVSDLFYNTPARKKFIRSAAKEQAAISETVGRLALSRPDVGLRLASNGREVLATSGLGDLLDTVAAVFGGGLAREMLPVGLEAPGMAVFGYVGRAGVSRSTRRHQVFFVNGRHIRSPYLAAAVDEALHSVLPPGRHPVLVLELKLDPLLVDVNVHPAKHEVRFSRMREVFLLVRQAVRQAVGRGPNGWATVGCSPPLRPSRPVFGEASVTAEPPWQLAFNPEAEIQEEPEAYAGFPDLEPLGLLPPTYLLARGADGLYVVDQHAAHERILFERFLDVLGVSGGRQVVVPTTVGLRGRDVQALEEYGAFLSQAGFEVELFGEDSYLIRGVPAFLGPYPGGEETLLRDVLERLAGEKPADREAFSRVLAAVLACHRAV
ncbi:MAG: DNA mismatch repair endonuclease MutL, partial [Candidatus Desulforudis sp.]|nr:DNA mismatch repair endonuclease MutL [Desulforudis sp.]